MFYSHGQLEPRQNGSVWDIEYHVNNATKTMHMLGAKYGFVQSTDCAAQTKDPYFVRQSMDFVCAVHGSCVSIRAQSTNLRIIHGLRCANNRSPGSLAGPVQR